MRSLRSALALLLATAATTTGLLTTGATAAQAGVDDVVVMLHGYHSGADGQSGNDAYQCTDFWAVQRQALRAAGHRGPTYTVGWYSDNVAGSCDVNLQSTVYSKDFAGRAGDGPANNGQPLALLTHNSPLEHVGYRFAWAMAKIADDNPGRNIQVIANSLGGPMVRHAIVQVSRSIAGYPALNRIRVSGVYTYASPLRGTTLARWGDTVQAQQSRPAAGFIQYLNAADNRGRVGSATWYGFAGAVVPGVDGIGDGLVSRESACLDVSRACFSGLYLHDQYHADRDFNVVKLDFYAARYPTGRAPDGATADPRTWYGPHDNVGANGIVSRLIAGAPVAFPEPF